MVDLAILHSHLRLQRAVHRALCARLGRAAPRSILTCVTAVVALLSLTAAGYAQGELNGGDAGAAAERKIAVQIRAAKLREAPKHFAEGVAELNFGEQLAVVSHTGGWYHARTLPALGKDAVLGYLHESAATKRRIVLSTQQVTLADLAVDEAQVYLAGKGFNEQVERSYSKDPSNPNYAALNGLPSTLTISATAARTFIKEGELVGEE